MNKAFKGGKHKLTRIICDKILLDIKLKNIRGLLCY